MISVKLNQNARSPMFYVSELDGPKLDDEESGNDFSEQNKTVVDLDLSAVLSI